jgi:hypothetical protein
MKITVLSIGEPVGPDAIRLVSKTVKWHSRPSKIKRGGTTRGTPRRPLPKDNKNPKRRHYTRYLAEQAMVLGWLNGVRIRRTR